MIAYSFKVIKVNKDAKSMEVLYSSPGYSDILIGTRMPYKGESLDAIVAMYAPIRMWEEQTTEVEDIVEGIHGSVDSKVAEPTDEELIRLYTSYIQDRLDEFATTRGYDSMLSACTYATSTDPKFSAEGKRAVQLRDATWSAAYMLFDKVSSGEMDRPSSIDTIIELLPELTWAS